MEKIMENTVRKKFAQLMFYARESYWHHAEELCSSVIATTDDRLFRVWRALCYDQQGLRSEALREYKALESNRQVAVPALMGIWIVYKRNQNQDELTSIELRMQDDKHAKDIDGWVHAALMVWAVGDAHMTREVINTKIPESAVEGHSDEYINFSTVKAWVDLSSDRGALLEKCGALFQHALSLESNLGQLDISAALGRVDYLERKHQFSQALELLNKLIVSHPTFTTTLVVKARLLMHVEDWEQAVAVIRSIIAVEPDSMEALALQALHALVKDSRPEASVLYLKRLWESMQRKEPRNAPLLHQYARAFSRLANRQRELLDITAAMMELACRLDSRNGDYLCEVGYEQLYRDDFSAAQMTFQKAGVLTASLEPLMGLVHVYLRTNPQEAAKQLSLCNELHPTSQRNAELCLLNAKVQWVVEQNEAKALLYLDQAAEAARLELQHRTGSGFQRYARLNLPLMLWIARFYIEHSRNEPPDPTFRHPDPIAEKCRKHLEIVLRYVPGCAEAHLMLCRVQFVSGNINAAMQSIKQRIQEQSLSSDLFLLSAQICQYIGNIELASQALEQALSIDFTIKEKPRYNLLHGMVLSSLGKHAAARDTLLAALKLSKSPNAGLSSPVGNGAGGLPVGKNGSPASDATLSATGGDPAKLSREFLSVPDMVTLYIQLAQVYVRLRDNEEARRLLNEAVAAFINTNQSGRIAIAQSMLVARTNVDKSIELLRQVPASSAFYIATRTQMAKLYLSQKHDPVQYIHCFEEMVKERPSPQSYVELGEAFLNVQDPEKAMMAYEKAKAMDPDNSELAVRIGRVLVSTHDYEKSVQYYSNALKADKTLFAVRADLAMLYWRLGRGEKAVEVLQQAPAFTEEPQKAEEVAFAIERVNCALLLYRVYRGLSDDRESVKALILARSFQQHVLENKMARETHETVLQQRSVMANILTELGKLYARRDDNTRAHQYLQEALNFDATNEAAMLALAQLCLEANDLEHCEQHCNTLLRIHPSCAEAVEILAEMNLLREDSFDAASRFFKQLLAQQPNNYAVLVKYIDLLRRVGSPEEVTEALDKAVAAAPAMQRVDPGLSYAQGVGYHLLNNNSDALRSFNLARLPTDNPWSERALERMIEIYLVPTTVDLWADTCAADERTENIRCAEQLLLQLPIGETRQVLQGYCWLATKRETDVEKALQIFLTVISQAQCEHPNFEKQSGTPGQAGEVSSSTGGRKSPTEDDLLLTDIKRSAGDDPANSVAPTLAAALRFPYVHIAGFLGLAMALYLSKQETAARNVLQRIFEATTPRQREQYAEVIVRARLLMAHLFIQQKSLEDAAKELQQTLEQNKNCSAGWNQLGFIHERQGRHAEASAAYQRAWALSQENDPAIGFRVAFNYLKGGDPVRAIDVSKKVLSRHPAYPRIEEEVLVVAYSMLKP